jgi:hypothetical protein
MSKFKIGDVVRIIGDSIGYSENFVGKEYAVLEAENGLYSLRIYSNGGLPCVLKFWEKDLEIVKTHYDSTSLQQAMQGWNVATSEPVAEYTATDILQEATECLTARAVERDKGTSERSMKAAVEAFNALTGHELTEVDGWLTMVCLKAARAEGGKFRLDDYIDGAAYFALYGEAASKQNDARI